jgi:hypothetical protein
MRGRLISNSILFPCSYAGAREKSKNSSASFHTLVESKLSKLRCQWSTLAVTVTLRRGNH